MNREKLVYVTYIATTPEKLWKALLQGDLTRQYWQHENVSDWKVGSKWEHVSADGKRTVKIVGKVAENVPNKRLVLTWADVARPSDESRVTFDIDKIEDMVRLTVTHDELVAGSEMLRKVGGGWPRVLSSMKTFLETGKPLNTWA